jgi:hypothetical protein
MHVKNSSIRFGHLTVNRSKLEKIMPRYFDNKDTAQDQANDLLDRLPYHASNMKFLEQFLEEQGIHLHFTTDDQDPILELRTKGTTPFFNKITYGKVLHTEKITPSRTDPEQLVSQLFNIAFSYFNKNIYQKKIAQAEIAETIFAHHAEEMGYAPKVDTKA